MISATKTICLNKDVGVRDCELVFDDMIQKCTTPMCSNPAVPYWVEDEDGTAIFLNTDMCDHCVEMMLGRK